MKMMLKKIVVEEARRQQIDATQSEKKRKFEIRNEIVKNKASQKWEQNYQGLDEVVEAERWYPLVLTGPGEHPMPNPFHVNDPTGEGD